MRTVTWHRLFQRSAPFSMHFLQASVRSKSFGNLAIAIKINNLRANGRSPAPRCSRALPCHRASFHPTGHGTVVVWNGFDPLFTFSHVNDWKFHTNLALLVAS